MHKKSILLTCFSIFIIVAFLTGCAGLMGKPTEGNFKAPIVTLSHVEVPYYTGIITLAQR